MINGFAYFRMVAQIPWHRIDVVGLPPDGNWKFGDTYEDLERGIHYTCMAPGPNATWSFSRISRSLI